MTSNQKAIYATRPTREQLTAVGQRVHLFAIGDGVVTAKLRFGFVTVAFDNGGTRDVDATYLMPAKQS